MKTNSKPESAVLCLAKSPSSHGGATFTGWTVLYCLCALLLVFSAQGKTLTWSGSAVPNANWSVSANWGGVGTPANGDTIIFSGSHTNAFVNTNNFVSLSLNQIQFVGDNTFGVMFDLRGQPFTLTGSILATNVTGTNIIENDLTLPNASELIVVSNSDQLLMEGVLSGPGGVTKAGAGTLTYQCFGNNTYTNTTLVNGGVLQFNVSGSDAVSGPLVIGDGTGDYDATVEDLQRTEMNAGPSVTINDNGELNLNNFDEPFFTTNLTLNDGLIGTGNGTLTLLPNPTFTILGTDPIITGNLYLNGGTLTLQGNGMVYFDANLGGTGNILQTGGASTVWYGVNTYSGNFTAQSAGFVNLGNSQALGNTNNTLTLDDNAELIIDGANYNITNQSLTINSTSDPAILSDPQTYSWTGSFIFNSPVTIDVFTNGVFTLNGPISGAGSVSKTDFGHLVFTGTNANTYAGATAVHGGLLLLNKAGGLPAVPGNLVIYNSAAVRLENSGQMVNTADVFLDNTALFDLGTFSTFINTLRGDGTVNFGTGGWIVVGENNGTSEFNGSFTGTGYAPGFTVGKEGAGTFIIGGDSSFTAGIMHVYQGELVVNGYQPAIPVTVDAGAALDGSGFVGEIKANGTVEPGTFGLDTGTLSTGDVTFSSTGNFTVQLSGDNNFGVNSYDQLYAIGPVGTNFLGNATLTILSYFPEPLAVGQQFVILNGQGTGIPLLSDVISGTFKGLPNGATFSQDGVGFQINYSTYQVVLMVTSLPAKPVITGIQPGGGGFQISGTGTTNATYSVWASTNLTTTNWMEIGGVTVPANTNVFQFTDPNMMYYAALFYRFTWP